MSAGVLGYAVVEEARDQGRSPGSDGRRSHPLRSPTRPVTRQRSSPAGSTRSRALRRSRGLRSDGGRVAKSVHQGQETSPFVRRIVGGVAETKLFRDRRRQRAHRSRDIRGSHTHPAKRVGGVVGSDPAPKRRPSARRHGPLRPRRQARFRFRFRPRLRFRRHPRDGRLQLFVGISRLLDASSRIRSRSGCSSQWG